MQDILQPLIFSHAIHDMPCHTLLVTREYLRFRFSFAAVMLILMPRHTTAAPRRRHYFRRFRFSLFFHYFRLIAFHTLFTWLVVIEQDAATITLDMAITPPCFARQLIFFALLFRRLCYTSPLLRHYAMLLSFGHAICHAMPVTTRCCFSMPLR